MSAPKNPLTVPRPRAARRRRTWRTALAIAFAAAVLCLVLRLPTPAHAQPPIVTAWQALNAQCKGGHSDDPKTVEACKKRDEVSARLKRRGCLYQEDGDWWKCPHH
jgi:hypothetical protein